MAVTTTVVRRTVWGDRKVVHATLAFDTSYPSPGGEDISLVDLGLKEVDFCMPAPSKGFVPEWDDANSKMKLYWVDTTVDGAAMAEVVNGTNVSTITALQAIFVGY